MNLSIKYLILFLFLLTVFAANGVCQQQTAPDKYFIRFTDKQHSPYSISQPEKFLSPKALKRRQKFNIPVTTQDLPVSALYTDSLKKLGYIILTTSKWFNAATLYIPDSAKLAQLSGLDFIKHENDSIPTQLFAQLKNKKKFIDKLKTKIISDTTLLDYGNAARQIEMVRGNILHNHGYLGQGMTIAVIDAGFFRVDSLPAFDSLRFNHQILGTRNLVDNKISVYTTHPHGMMVLSILGGNIPKEIIGTAPKADYWLLQSEDASSEYLIEEDNWVAAAEFADSAGADVITSSLGYTQFNDPAQNLTYADMNGKTARVSIGASIAASKGILVVVSAGNEGNDPWKYIPAPGDADSVLTVGAVDSLGRYAYFSSVGPTSDGRIKPNVVAMGIATAIESPFGFVSSGNGTSFSAPVIAGLSACLWQAHPALTNMDVLQSVEQSSSQFFSPDSLLGYGIPDFASAAGILQFIREYKNDSSFIRVFPNPFTNNLTLEFQSGDYAETYIQIYNIKGQVIYTDKKNIKRHTLIHLDVREVKHLAAGIYLLKITNGDQVHQVKLVRTNAP
ncbi:MAG TPA: S8 family serine peptidase [Bacteroidales bacterium]|nr:S8 family serine peptidase [Bacteroidales bacterium]